MFGFFREKRAARTIDRLHSSIMNAGFPLAFGKDATAGYLASFWLAKHLYMHMFFGSTRIFKNSDAGRSGHDEVQFAFLTTATFAAAAPYMGINKEQMAVVLGWQLRSVPEVWHEQIIGLAEALVEQAGDFAFQSNSILALMKEISSTTRDLDDEPSALAGFLFNGFFVACVTDTQKHFLRLRSSLSH